MIPKKTSQEVAEAGSGLRGQAKLHTVASIALLAIVVLIAYSPSLSGGFIWDDDAHVTKPELRSWGGLGRIWLEVGATQQYYPLLHTAFWIEHALWGDNTLGYHLANLLEHFLASCLIWLILRKLAVPGALLAAAIFALHPVNVESVAWISEQKNTLSAVFYLSAMLCYLHFEESRITSTYVWASVFFLLGLLTKTVTATLPAALLVVFWWQHGKLSWRRDVQPLIIWFIQAAIAGIFTALVERKLIGAEGADFQLALLQRFLIAGRVIWFYVANLLWPSNLIFIYPRWNVDPQIWWQWLFPLAALAATAAFWFIRSRWRAPLACWLFFVGTLFPALGFFNVYPFIYSFVADHFQYLASLGIIVPVAAATHWSLQQIARQSSFQPRLQIVAWLSDAGVILALAILAIFTWNQNRMYGDAITLYQTTIAKNSQCWMALNNLGVELVKRDKPNDALRYYQTALAIKPDYAEAHNNLGNALFKLNRPNDAIEQYQQAIAAKPNYPGAETNLGNALISIGQTQQAADHYERALKFNPNYALAQFNLGNTYLSEGQPKKAIDHYYEAIRLKLDDSQVHYNLGIALGKSGAPEDAVRQFRTALKLNPSFAGAHNNLGATLMVLGRTQEAIDQCNQALQLDPNDQSIYENLTNAYLKLNRTADAIAIAEKAALSARSHGQNEMAQRIETWIAKVRAEQNSNPDALPNAVIAPAP